MTSAVGLAWFSCCLLQSEAASHFGGACAASGSLPHQRPWEPGWDLQSWAHLIRRLWARPWDNTSDHDVQAVLSPEWEPKAWSNTPQFYSRLGGPALLHYFYLQSSELKHVINSTKPKDKTSKNWGKKIILGRSWFQHILYTKLVLGRQTK